MKRRKALWVRLPAEFKTPLFLGNIIGQGINFISFPIWLYFYPIEVVSSYGSTLIFAGFLSILLSQKIENMVYSAENESELKRYRNLGMTSVLFLSIPIILASLSSPKITIANLEIYPIYVVFYAVISTIINLSVAFCIRNNDISRIALYAVVRPVLSGVSVVSFGLISNKIEYFLFSQLISMTLTFFFVLNKEYRFKILGLKTFTSGMRRDIKQKVSFMSEAFTHNVSSNIIFLLVASTSPSDVTALYFFADKILQSLSQIITESERPFFITRFVKTKAENSPLVFSGILEFKLIKHVVLGFIAFTLSIPYVALIGKWSISEYIWICYSLLVLWTLRLLLMPFTSFAIVYRLAWYVLCQSLVQLGVIIFVFSNIFNFDSLVSRLLLVIFFQYSAQLLLLYLLRKSSARLREGAIPPN
jgi:hypothetical protein